MRSGKGNKASALGQYFGYSVQPTRMCFHLLLAPSGSAVTLEVLDDVDVKTLKGEVIVEQDKSGLSTNPISNWAVDLWKTFSNWITAIEKGELDLAKTRFRLYVVQDKKGDFADLLKFAHSGKIAMEVVEKIRSAYASAKPGKAKKYIEKFLGFEESKLARLIMNFDLECGSSDLLADIKSILQNTVPDTQLDKVCIAAIGWVKVKTDQLIVAGKHPVIQKNEFSDWLNVFTTQLPYDHLLTYTLPAPSQPEIDQEMSNALTLIRQIDLIGLETVVKKDALSDYLQSRTHKVLWAEKGVVMGKQFKDYEKLLFDHWDALQLEINTLHSGVAEPARGQLIYKKCQLVNAPLVANSPPTFFARGTFQRFANEQVVGWHPQFKALLNTSEGD